jgi:outer membrane protein assembly factor BamB
VRTEGSRIGTLKTVWRFDCNPPELRFLNRKAIRYKTRGDGPSEIIATPVFHQNRVYVAVGQDPTHGRGKGCLSCIDATQTGTITDTGKIWSYSTIDRSLSTVAIHDGLLYAADYSGKLHCLDADTGEAFWVHTMRAPIWGSPLVADGKVYLGTVRGYLNVFRDAPREALIDRIRVGSAIYSTPVAANGVLYVMARSRLLAFAKSRDASQAVEEVVLPEEEPDSDLSELTGESETD